HRHYPTRRCACAGSSLDLPDSPGSPRRASWSRASVVPSASTSQTSYATVCIAGSPRSPGTARVPTVRGLEGRHLGGRAQALPIGTKTSLLLGTLPRERPCSRNFPGCRAAGSGMPEGVRRKLEVPSKEAGVLRTLRLARVVAVL